MLSNPQLPKGFWVEALAIVVHLINRLPNKRLDIRVAEELWSGKAPHISILECLVARHTAIFQKRIGIN